MNHHLHLITGGVSTKYCTSLNDIVKGSNGRTSLPVQPTTFSWIILEPKIYLLYWELILLLTNLLAYSIILPKFLVSAVVCREVARVDWLSSSALPLQSSVSRSWENFFFEIIAREILGAVFMIGLQVNGWNLKIQSLLIEMNLRFM